MWQCWTSTFDYSCGCTLRDMLESRETTELTGRHGHHTVTSGLCLRSTDWLRNLKHHPTVTVILPQYLPWYNPHFIIYYGFVFKSSPICQTCINKKSRASRCRYLCVVMKRQGTDGNCNLEVVWTAPGLCDKISAMSIKLTLTSSTTHTWGHTDINRFVLNYVQHGWKTCYECKMCMVQMCGWPQ